ncbi:FAD-binding oxidoreductase [Virgibacillus sp. NKC19-3]|uniref:NAD(P)/FAD-dependent oxidoreductase n=1 Tax=Virgibacillus saliphilus TaxID=2831674 RepID=UPI001C9A399A|nr:FAD-dependent oxidoreductase [Virgibacillus sp. NKC19-3]MBY7142509.1 FAD-binding oxidoreductase [Virgibacillus sp. NKC19-3]
MKIIIIGSGIVGASAAYHLAKNNIDVIVVDKEHQGNATSAGAGIVCPWISSVQDEDWYSIAKGGARFYPTLIAQLKEDGEHDVGYKKVGALAVNSDTETLDEIERRASAKQKDAPEMGDIVRLNAAQTRERFPLLNEDLESVFVPGAARVDGRLLRNALKRAAQKHGAEMIKGEAKLLYHKTSVEGVEVNGEKLYADTVLIATGAWAPSLLAPLGIDLHVEPQRGQIAHIHLPNTDTSNWPVVLPQTSHYMLAFDDSRVVAGATRETGAGFDYRTTAGGVHEVTSEALHVAPGLSDGTLQEVRIGFRPMGPDVLPILGEMETLNGVVLATGLGASGLTMGPYVGTLAAALTRGEDTGIDLSPYTPMRALSSDAKV